MKTRRKRKQKKHEAVTTAEDMDTVCVACDAEFLDPEDLRVHIAQVHPFTSNKGHTCIFCLASYTDIIDYLCHLRDEHFAHMKCCKYCNRGFLDCEELMKHEEKHISTKSDMYSCSHCSTLFSSLNILQNHEMVYHSDSKQGIVLQQYYPLLSTLLNNHADKLLQMLGTPNAEYICRKCNFKTPNFSEYSNHLKKAACTTLACNKCAKVFLIKLSLTKHFINSPECWLDYDPLLYRKRCQECKKMFSLTDYRLHYKKCRIIKCSVCDIVFQSFEELTEHQKNEHPITISLLKCRYCQQEIVGPVAYKKHVVRLHRKDYHLYKYKCLHCSAIFKHPKKFFCHMYSTHKTILPYWCKICDERFRIRKTFTIHIKMKHDSKGFVQFDQDMNVHFSETKTENFILPENTSLFTEEEAKDLPIESEYETDIEGPNKKKLTKKSETVSTDIPDTELTTDMGSENDTNVVTDTQAEQVVSTKKTSTRKRKPLQIDIDSSSDEDMPLNTLRKRAKLKKVTRNKTMMKIKNMKRSDVPRRLTCAKCKKYCFTVDNYNRHMSMHFKNESKQCVKCAKFFATTDEINNHMKTEHATSHITETLRKLLERKNKVIKGINEDIPISEKFQKTVKRVALHDPWFTASVKKIENGLSVKKFLESFVPDDAKAENIVNVKPVTNILKREVIKMTKFKPEKITAQPVKLKMPTKFNKNYLTSPTATVKKIATTCATSKLRLNFLNSTHQTNDDDAWAPGHTDDEYMDSENGQYSTIPEVAQEVMLENTDQEVPKISPQTSLPHELIIPNIGKHATAIKIAHLQPQAPYYKIIKMTDIINPAKTEEQHEEFLTNVTLPSGRIMINSNPLAHLLGDKEAEFLNNAHKKRQSKYKPKTNLRKALADALLKLDTPPPPVVEKVKKAKAKYEPKLKPAEALAMALEKLNKPKKAQLSKGRGTVDEAQQPLPTLSALK